MQELDAAMTDDARVILPPRTKVHGSSMRHNIVLDDWLPSAVSNGSGGLATPQPYPAVTAVSVYAAVDLLGSRPRAGVDA